MGQGAGNAVVVEENAPVIRPFWERLPTFFLYPLRPANLLPLLGLAFASVLAPVLPIPNVFAYPLLFGLILLGGVRRGFAAMEEISRGYLDDAVGLLERDPERVNLPWKLFGVMLVWSFVVGLAFGLGSTLGYLAQGFTVLTLPAAIIALSISNSFAAGLNPALWLRVVRALGRGYGVMLIFLFLLSGGSDMALPLLKPLLRGWLALPALAFAFLYFTLVMFALMGYAIYQYHWALGVTVDCRRRPGSAGAEPPATPAEDLIAASLAAGDLQAALDAAYEQQRMTPDDAAALERYFRVLLLAGQQDKALNQGRRLLSLYLARGQGGAALPLMRELQGLNPEWQPAVREILPLAEAARGGRDPALALTLVRGFDKRNPGHPDIPGVYFLSARILSEHYRDDVSARKILEVLCSRFPDHPVLAEAEPYRKVLAALAAGA